MAGRTKEERKMKNKIYQDENIIVYGKKELEVGKEADIADSLIVAAFQGYMTFASHLKSPKKFYEQVKFGLKQMLKELK